MSRLLFLLTASSVIHLAAYDAPAGISRGVLKLSVMARKIAVSLVIDWLLGAVAWHPTPWLRVPGRVDRRAPSFRRQLSLLRCRSRPTRSLPRSVNHSRWCKPSFP